MIALNINRYYSLDGLSEEEYKELKKSVECINDFLKTKNDKITIGKNGFRTSIQIDLNNIKISGE